MATRYVKKNYYSSKGTAYSEKREKIIKFSALALAVIAAVTAFWVISCRNKQEQEAVAALSARKRLTGVAWYPRVVGKGYILDGTYVPEELTYLYGIPDGTGKQLTREAAAAYTDMQDAMSRDGLGILVLEAYVPYTEAYTVYNAQMSTYISSGLSEQKAYEKASKAVEMPGTSEHQLGEALDVSTNGKKQSNFAKTDQGRWLSENAAEYGFIFRYPENKKDITGRSEPWHLRYVGVDAARYMSKYDLCLEEYVKLVKSESPRAVSREEYKDSPLVTIDLVSNTDSTKKTKTTTTTTKKK